MTFCNCQGCLETEADGVAWTIRASACLLLAAALVMAVGCSGTSKKKTENYFTSGSRAADLRGSQDVSQEEKSGGTTKAGEDSTKGKPKQPLYDRLGGEHGIAAVVEEFTVRVLQDPRVNWDREGVKHGGLFTRHKSVAWRPTPENVALLKQHLVQFLSLACGGPANYHDSSIKAVHADMEITAAEFDAAVGDLKASLDRLHVDNREQKDLLAIVESTRPEIVAEK